MKNGVLEGVASVEGRESRRFRFAPAMPFAALTRRGSRWPPGSLLISAVVMPKHEAAMQIVRWLNELAMVGVFSSFWPRLCTPLCNTTKGCRRGEIS